MTPTKMTVLLNVEDYDLSVTYYQHVGFDLATEARDGAMAWGLLACGPLQLMLNQTRRAMSQRRRDLQDYSDVVVYLYVEDAKTEWLRLQDLGVQGRHVGPQDYGLDEVWLRDPDGYHIVVASEANRGAS